MNESIQAFLLIFLSLDALVLLILLIYKLRSEWKRRQVLHFGDRAEEKVSEELQRQFPGSVILDNVYLKTRKGSTQLDHILICKWGVYVIETKSHNGRIEIGKREWIQIYGDKVIRFHSPLLQNESHTRALKAVLEKSRSLSRIPVKGIVVFTSGKMHFSKRHEGVIRLHEISPYIKSGGKTTSHRALLTASPGMRYLTRQKISLIEKQIRKHCVRSTRKQRIHSKKLRSLDRSIY